MFLDRINRPPFCPQCRSNKLEIEGKDTVRARKIEIEELPETADAIPVSLRGIIKGKIVEDMNFKRVLVPGNRVRMTCIP